MGLLDDIEAECRPAKGPVCGVVAILAALDATDRKVVQAALEDPAKSHAGIARALTRNGHSVKGGTISRHRKGECSCGAR